jgi:hypothetical protein
VLFAQPGIKRLSPGADGSPLAPGAAQQVALFAVAVYLGYFGAAAGVMLLIALGMMIDEPLATVNAVKNAVSGMANAMAAAGPLRVIVSLCGIGLAVRLGLTAYR